MTDAKKKMSSRRFMAIFLPVTAVLLATSIVITCVMEYWSTVMDAVFGEADISINAAPGTETWNTDYYNLKADGMTPEETAAQGAALARRAEAEGIVLLKNQNNALPLTTGGTAVCAANPITVNALGWSFYYPSTGGSGSGAVGSDGLVSPKEALAAAGIQINEELEDYYLDWSQQHYTEWMVTKANGYYSDEDTNTSPARPSVSKTYQAAWDVPELNAQLVADACAQSDAAANNVQIVWIGRGGGEYHDCPTEMTKTGGSVNAYGINPDKHYLELTDEEEAVLAKAEELRGENGKVIVIINANNTMELGELADDDKDLEMPATGQNNGLQLIDLRGLDFDDPLWQSYVEQWTPSEMALLLGKAGFQTEAFTEYGKPTTLDNDGPQAFRHQALGEENERVNTYYMTAFPCEALLSCTWNQDLLEEIGQNVGAEGSVNGMSGWYAPGLNTHRTAFGGRNFEYFSEDPFLAGKLAASEISGAADYGVFTYIKHFAMNEQEAFCRSWCCGMHMDESLDRYQNPEWMLMTWATEQTMREIYLKAFEIAIAVVVLSVLRVRDEKRNPGKYQSVKTH